MALSQRAERHVLQLLGPFLPGHLGCRIRHQGLAEVQLSQSCTCHQHRFKPYTCVTYMLKLRLKKVEAPV